MFQKLRNFMFFRLNIDAAKIFREGGLHAFKSLQQQERAALDVGNPSGMSQYSSRSTVACVNAFTSMMWSV